MESFKGASVILLAIIVVIIAVIITIAIIIVGLFLKFILGFAFTVALVSMMIYGYIEYRKK
jgi:hypothetical protein